MKTALKRLGVIITLILIIVISNNIVAKAETAKPVTPHVVFSNGDSGYNILDGSYDTEVVLNSGDEIIVTLDEPTKGIYIIWGSPVQKWTLIYENKEETRGNNGFLHEYIQFDIPITQFSIKCETGNTITDLYCYGEGELPEDVQVWKPECEKADILLVSTHADDELLFFGGILPTYAGEKQLEVQVVYFSEYWTGAKIREHEKLDGLWHAGVRNYPITGDFPDLYAEDLETAKTVFDENETIEFIVEMIRRFKPQVIVAQDENGEYGHGAHMLTSYATKEAVNCSMDAEKYPDSATKYGIWDVQKTYIHLYGENQIFLDCRSPLTAFDGKTALEVAAESYKKHVSQQWCWFYVDDEYKYSCAKFGLYRTTVGIDSLNDMMENIVDYKTQAEEESKRLEEERIKESESIAEEESRLAELEKQSEIAKQDEEKKQSSSKFVILGIVLAVFVVLFCIYYLLFAKTKKHKKRVNNKKINKKQKNIKQKM